MWTPPLVSNAAGALLQTAVEHNDFLSEIRTTTTVPAALRVSAQLTATTIVLKITTNALDMNNNYFHCHMTQWLISTA
jgi:hypothetical protein